MTRSLSTSIRVRWYSTNVTLTSSAAGRLKRVILLLLVLVALCNLLLTHWMSSTASASPSFYAMKLWSSFVRGEGKKSPYHVALRIGEQDKNTIEGWRSSSVESPIRIRYFIYNDVPSIASEIVLSEDPGNTNKL